MKKTIIMLLAALALVSLTGCDTLLSLIAASQNKEVTYHVGDKGPAGGTVIYDKGSRTNGWRYIEAAPEDVSYGEAKTLTFGYAREGNWGSNQLAGTEAGIGSGAANTALLIAAMGSEAYRTNSGNLTLTNYAALIAKTYSSGGSSDWVMPSVEELKIIASCKAIIPGLDKSASYWSSTEYQNATSAYYVDMSTGKENYAARENSMKVRAIRYF